MKALSSKKVGRFSLSVRVSLLLMLAALVPLIVTISSSEILSRPQLIAQANASMAADAQSHIQSIENYFSQPIIDVSSLSPNSALANYLNGDFRAANDAINVLKTGYQRNVNYISWSLVNLQGDLLASYPGLATTLHGNYNIPPDTLKQLNIPNRALISSAFFDPEGNKLTVDITEPVALPNTVQIVGYIRASLNISFIWNLVLGERGVNGEGSYAFITDQNGVIIAHSNVSQNFTAIAPFSTTEQQDINTLVRYGNTKIPTFAYNTLSDALKNSGQQVTFQMVPPDQTESFQVIGRTVPLVPWMYFVLSPTRVVTALADQQLLDIGVIGLVVLLIAAMTGLLVGRGITEPVLRAVTKLQSSSQILKDLAAKEQVTVTEQIWVVDASKTGLSSVHYYTDATQFVAQQIIGVGVEFEKRWKNLRPEKTKEIIHQIVIAADYITNAVMYQKESSKKLSAAIDLTKQVTDQLVSSAESATGAAEQMEQVVSQLQHVVGKNN